MSLRAKLSDALSRSPSPKRSPRNSTDLSANNTSAKQEADKYRLLVTAGPAYDTSTHKIVHLNTDTPTYIENDFLRAKVKVRIRGFQGLPSSSPSTSPYFEDSAHEKDQYSVAASFVPKRDLPSKNVIWGNDFDHPVRDRLPPGFNTAFKIVKEWIDPGLECDAYADEPWLYGPALSCWFGFRIGEKIGEDGEIPEGPEPEDIVREGAEGSGKEVREKQGLPENNEKRRKFFLSQSHREPFSFEKDRLYSFDFYNPYLDFGNFALKLPGFSIKVIKYIDEKSHTLRYVFKNRETGDVYLCINFNLLWGEQLQRALKDDQDQLKAFAGAEANGSDEKRGREKPNEYKETSPDQPDTTAPDTSAEVSESRPSIEVTDTSNEDPGLRDKPDKLREQVQHMSISETLQNTASGDKRMDGSTRVLDDLD